MKSILKESHFQEKKLIPIEGDRKIFSQTWYPKNKKVEYHFFFFHRELFYHKEITGWLEFLKISGEDNFAISTIDYSGHGKSQGARSNIKRMKDVIDPILEWFSSFYFNQEKVIFISQGFGSLVAMSLLSRYKKRLPFEVSKSIYLNPLMSPRIFASSRVEMALKKLSPFVGDLKLPIHFNAWDLTEDKNNAEQLDKDYLYSRKIGLDFFKLILQESKNSEKYLSRLNGEQFFLISDNDLNHGPRTLKLIEGVEGRPDWKIDFLKRSKYDLLNGKRKKVVFEKMMKWIGYE